MIINRIQISDIGMLCSGERQIKIIYLNLEKSQKTSAWQNSYEVLKTDFTLL